MVKYEQNEVDVLLNELIYLLTANNENRWLSILNNLRTKYKDSSNKQEVASMIIQTMQGGMGSISDLVIQKDGKMLVEANDKLDKLLDNLYEACNRIQKSKKVLSNRQHGS